MNFFKSEYLKHLSSFPNSLKQLKLTLGDSVKISMLKCFIFITFFQHTCTYDLDTLSFFPPSRFSWSRLHMSVEWPTLNKYETNKQTRRGDTACCHAGARRSWSVRTRRRWMATTVRFFWNGIWRSLLSNGWSCKETLCRGCKPGKRSTLHSLQAGAVGQKSGGTTNRNLWYYPPHHWQGSPGSHWRWHSPSHRMCPAVCGSTGWDWSGHSRYAGNLPGRWNGGSVNASNAFNCLNRQAALHNIEQLCRPPFATIMRNVW